MDCPTVFSTRVLSNSQVIHIPIETAAKKLQDPDALIGLNPLVFAYTKSPSDPDLYTITYKIPILNYFSLRIQYSAKFSKFPNGFEARVSAGLGTTLVNRWTLTPADGGGLLLVEQVTITALFLFMPFIVSNVKVSHNLAALAAVLEGHSSTSTYGRWKKHSDCTSAFKWILLCCTITVSLFYIPFWEHFNFTNGITTIFTLILSIVSFVLFNRSHDPYGLFHLDMNILPGAKPTSVPCTEWLNMGYWKDTDVFSEACEALALKLLAAADYKGGNVLDVGHGTGESLIFLLSDPRIPRPSLLAGITSLQLHYERSLARTTRLQSSGCGSEVKLELYHGDAVYRRHPHDRPSAPVHPLNPGSASPPFDSILALDCAYHFVTRCLFLEQAFARLVPGRGRVALADIAFLPSSSFLRIFGPRNPPRQDQPFIAALRAFLAFFPTPSPRCNVISIEEYVQDMINIGYVDVKVKDISGHVFPQFAQFLRGRGWGWYLLAQFIELYHWSGARFIIISGSRPP